METTISTPPPNMSFFDVLVSHQDRILFEGDDGRAVRYMEVIALADSPAFARTSGRLVFCLCENDLDSLQGYVSLLGARAVPLMLGASIADSKLEALLAAYKPDFLWCPKGRLESVPAAKSVRELGTHVLAEFDSPGYPIDERHALLLSTSGTTGSPKFVRISHRNVLSNAFAIAEYLGIHQDEIAITSLPPHYSYGLSVIHSHAVVGSKVAVTKATILEKAFWGWFDEVGATSFAGVPYQYETLRRLRFCRKTYPSLRTLTQAGGRLASEITLEFAEYSAAAGIRYFTMYGQTEASPRIAYRDPRRNLEKPDSIGQSIPGGRLWLEDENGPVVGGGDEVGELVFAGPNVAMGYAEGFSDLADGDAWGGVLHTADLARRDAEGDFFIVGRLKRFIKLFGNRTNLQEIESDLSSLGFDVGCAGGDDRLEVYLSGISLGEAERLKVYLCKTLRVPPNAVIIYGMGQLPRHDSGKLNYGNLRPELAEALA